MLSRKDDTLLFIAAPSYASCCFGNKANQHSSRRCGGAIKKALKSSTNQNRGGGVKHSAGQRYTVKGTPRGATKRNEALQPSFYTCACPIRQDLSREYMVKKKRKEFSKLLPLSEGVSPPDGLFMFSRRVLPRGAAPRNPNDK
ncbi:hypothetical protein EVAR_47107_1 [Eumeta japonica]|uniref:Uncharacterized protein n=1 Tax=Eumeta variegata TaxID=151549 RepID=A0A4C1YD07_EUMVA|nr:hypothetical protein EVAR_47107_1 [Eumeta japonica]